MKQDSPSSSKGFSLETGQPIVVKKLNLGPGETANSLELTVRLVPEETRALHRWLADIWRALWRDRWARGLAIFILVAVLALALQRPLFFSTLEPEYTIGPYAVFAQYPGWVAPRDEESLSITLLNSGTVDLTQVRIHLVSTNPLCLCTDTKGSTVIDFEDLAVGERKTRTVHFRLEKKPLGSPMRVQAHLISSERGTERFAPVFTTQVFFVPRYKTSIQKVWGGVAGLLGVTILALVGERFGSILGLKE
jgi:hypothetical protein